MSGIYKFILFDDEMNVIDIAEFEFDSVNFASPEQQAGSILVPDEDADYYAAGELNAYKLPDGSMRYIEEVSL